MKLIYNDIFLEHFTGNHPENQNRLSAFPDLVSIPIIDGLPFVKMVHNGQYIDDVMEKCKYNTSLDSDTLCSEKSFEAAVAAAGATVMASETNDFALVRPPGHHAYAGRASGFCIFNNVAIAAQNLVEQGKKVLIFDFDGHYGDGTSHIFFNTDQVMYWSIHQYPAFPGNGHSTDIGFGKGLGFNINVELPPGSGDDIFMDAFNTFLPVARQFNPDYVGVSAGFDSHMTDMLLDLKVSYDSFYKIGKTLSKNFENVFAVLEGGYNPEILVKSVENFIAGINHDVMPHFENKTESDIKLMDIYESKCNSLIMKLRKVWDI